MLIDKSTEEDYLNGRTFAQGYFLRIDAARATPKCKNGVSYSCGKSIRLFSGLIPLQHPTQIG